MNVPVAMVFGVFDGLHEGHRHFLTEAKGRCKILIVVLPPDAVVVALKGRAPRYTWAQRAHALSEFDAALSVVEGDTVAGSWDIIAAHTPDTIFLGYDQKELALILAEKGISFQHLAPHEEHRFKSSILRSA